MFLFCFDWLPYNAYCYRFFNMYLLKRTKLSNHIFGYMAFFFAIWQRCGSHRLILQCVCRKECRLSGWQQTLFVPQQQDRVKPHCGISGESLAAVRSCHPSDTHPSVRYLTFFWRLSLWKKWWGGGKWRIIQIRYGIICSQNLQAGKIAQMLTVWC